MAETPKTIPLHVQLDRDALKKLGRDLATAFSQLAADVQADAKRREETLEVGALFALYRELRGKADPVVAQGERDRLLAAIEGYDTRLLADLAAFGGWLADAAGKEWRRRDR